MIKANASLDFDIYVYRAGEDGSKITILRDSGGEILMEKLVEETHGRATSRLGVTLNLGNFESLRVDVGVDMPCNAREVESAIDEAYVIAENKLIEKVQLIKDKF